MTVRFAPAVEHLLVDINTIGQHPDNPNNGDIDAIGESIDVNDYLVPVIVQKSTGYIVDGNHRYVAVLERGATQIPALFVEMTDEQAHRYMYAANRTAQRAWMDRQMLLQGLKVMQDSELGLLGTGYSENDMALLAQMKDEAGRGADHRYNEPEKAEAILDSVINCPNCGHLFYGDHHGRT